MVKHISKLPSARYVHVQPLWEFISMVTYVLIYTETSPLSSDGYNKWRDAKKPTTILAELCRSNGIAPPEYRPSEVKVLNKIFKIPPDAVPEGKGQLGKILYCP